MVGSNAFPAVCRSDARPALTAPDTPTAAALLAAGRRIVSWADGRRGTHRMQSFYRPRHRQEPPAGRRGRQRGLTLPGAGSAGSSVIRPNVGRLTPFLEISIADICPPVPTLTANPNPHTNSGMNNPSLTPKHYLTLSTITHTVTLTSGQRILKKGRTAKGRVQNCPVLRRIRVQPNTRFLEPIRAHTSPRVKRHLDCFSRFTQLLFQHKM